MDMDHRADKQTDVKASNTSGRPFKPHDLGASGDPRRSVWWSTRALTFGGCVQRSIRSVNSVVLVESQR